MDLRGWKITSICFVGCRQRAEPDGAVCAGRESVQREDLPLCLVLALVHVRHEHHLRLQLVQHPLHLQQPIQVP